MRQLWHRWPVLTGTLLGLFAAAHAIDAAEPTTQTARVATNALDYAIIVTGGELLHGAFSDGHTAFLTRTLHPLGLHCVGSVIVDDRAEDIAEALRFATNKASLIIVTGGLGPTGNDVTRQALADFTGVPVRENTNLLAEMARRLGTPVNQLRENLRRQTRVPERGTYLQNSNGTAAGLVFDLGRTVIVALPGPPRELQPMVRHELVPYLTRRLGTRPPGCALTVRFVGLGQSQIDQVLTEHVPLDHDIILASQFEGGRVDFTFSLPTDTTEDRRRLHRIEEELLQHLGANIYADDDSTLEAMVLRALRARSAKLAVAEIATGGALAASFTQNIPTADVLAGSWAAPSLSAAQRLLSAEQAKLPALARAARSTSGAQAVVVVGERPVADAGAIEVLLELPAQDGVTFRVTARGTDAAARSALVTQILDQMRRALGLKVTPHDS